ncbi:MAG: FAD-dependent oxidoreductase [Synergistales bacterium]|jgi:NADPH-dependent 2,4-dienoyl-CoA reductase/sulfur reductase-like enzyme/rhodanese-related sulfurtransferase
MGKKVLIIGGVACGGKVAARLRRLDPEAEITVLEKGEFLSYAGCGLPFYVQGIVKEYRDLMSTPIGVIRDAAFFRKVKKVEVLTRHMATRIDRENRKVSAIDLSTGQEKEFPYEELVLATGGSPIRPKLPGVDMNRVYTLWTMDDALAMRAALDSGAIRTAVIIGGGLVGLEVVEALHARGVEVSVVEALDRPLPALFDEEFSGRVRKVLERKGVHFYGGERVTEILGEGCTLTGVRTNARDLPCDMVLMAIGVMPNTLLANEAGLALGPSGGIAVDHAMRTSDPHIYAGGDCVETFNLLTGKPVRQPMGSTANRQGRVIADAIAGRKTEFKGVLGTAILRLFETTAGRTGLSLEAARDAGFDPISVAIMNSDKPHFMPGSAPVILKIVADRGTGRILGAQAFGPGDVSKRLDTLVAAITGRLTIDDLADADLGYAPPYSTALDPLTHAANALRNKAEGLMKTYSPSELEEKVKRGEDFVLLDVRSPEETQKNGRLPFGNITYIPLGALWEKGADLPKDKEIVAFCKISVRGWDALSILRSHGIENIALLETGVAGWPFQLEA